MLNFRDQIEYSQEDLNRLILVQAEESIHLDFKSKGSLEKSDRKKLEIGKDVSSFSNADGGIIIYGMSEENHVASALSYIDGNSFTKEWLENVISTQISPRIDGIQIFPVRVDNNFEQTVYIVKIPASSRAPHMSSDNRYYRRYNFQSVPMEDYEVKAMFLRVQNTELEIMDLLIEPNGAGVKAQSELMNIQYKISFQVKNVSNSIEHNYKLEVHFPLGIVASDRHSDAHFIRYENGLEVYSFGNKTPLFQDELTTVHTLEIKLIERNFKELKHPVISYLYYSNGLKKREFNLASMLKHNGRSLYDWGWRIL